MSPLRSQAEAAVHFQSPWGGSLPALAGALGAYVVAQPAPSLEDRSEAPCEANTTDPRG